MRKALGIPTPIYGFLHDGWRNTIGDFPDSESGVRKSLTHPFAYEILLTVQTEHLLPSHG
jgi:hypothetical protein